MPARLSPTPKTVQSGRAAIPVVERISVAVQNDERGRLAHIAKRLLRDDPSLTRGDVFGPLVSAGLGDGPALLIGDQREIGLFADRPEQSLEHRIALLASDGDFLVVERRCPAHERYLEELLGIDRLRVMPLGAPPTGGPRAIATRCRTFRPLLTEIAAVARMAGRFQIIPHFASGASWALAAAIADRAGVPVRVAAPAPQLGKRINDKIWFANRVRDVLGPGALPPTFTAFGPAAVVGRVRRLAGTAERVIVKVPDSAGSLGNVVLEAGLVQRLEPRGLRDLVLGILRTRGWREGFPLLVGVWEADALASPSVQVWIPLPGHGSPLVEGVFEQRLAGPEAEFVGAVPAKLPAPLLRRVCAESVRLASLLQDLGHFGRCSFDCLVAGSEDGRGRVHWIECNGRWGGVSVPMTFVNRMFGARAGCGMVIVQDAGLKLRLTGAERTYDALAPLLLRRGGQEGIVPLSAGGFERGVGAYFLAVAATQAEAERLASEARATLALDA